MAATITGGCSCGAIRYECNSENPLLADHCYCRDCQRSSGAAMGSWLFVAKTAFKLIKGEVRYFEVVGDGGRKVSRGFCEICGSPLFATAEALPDGIGIRAGSLDDPNQYQPGVSLYLDSATV